MELGAGSLRRRAHVSANGGHWLSRSRDFAGWRHRLTTDWSEAGVCREGIDIIAG